MNVNSLQNKVEEVGSLIKESKAQVVFLTETKIDCTYPDSQFAQNGYSIYRNDRKKGGGGVMAYISDKLPSKRLGLPRKFTTIEPLAIQSKFGRHDALIVGIYRPPKPIGNNYHVTLENELHDLTSWASVQKPLLVITGDLNLDRLRPLSREGKILCDLEDTHGLTCVITRPTRITNNSQTLIDVILTNKPELFKDCGVFDVGISDHALVYGLMKERNGFYESKVLTVRSYKDLNEKELQMDLDMAPWHVSSIFDSIDDQYSYWHTLLTSIVNDHVPLKKMRVRAMDVPYMTLEWKKAIRKKRRFARRYARNPTEENRDLVKTWRNAATRWRRRAIKEYWKEKADDLKTNPKNFYSVFKPFLHSKSKKCEKTLLNLDIEGVIERDQRKITEHFAKYFSSVANDIGDTRLLGMSEDELYYHESVQTITQSCNHQLPGHSPKFKFHALEPREVAVALSELDPTKSTGHDLLPPKILKIASRELCYPLADLYNRCIESCDWPLHWKKGDWVPVFKKDNKQDIKNYRPVTVLTVIGKVFEQLLSKQLTSFIDPMLSNNLTAYRKGQSCETSLIGLVERWKQAVDNRNVVGVLSTDMSKAFDSLHPPLLINKLRAYGFSTDSLALMRSYFRDRKNRVRISQNASSGWYTTTRSCPQLSAFGPLWNVFQNDLHFSTDENRLFMYADDHQLFSVAKTTNEAGCFLTEEGNNISQWYNNNLLQGNFSKYQVMCLGPRNYHKDLHIVINDTVIDQKSEITLLGVTLDDQLSFSSHVRNICRNQSEETGVLLRLRNLIPTSAKLHIVKFAILPYLTYCRTVRHFCRSSDARKLERIQERALRAVYCDNKSTYEELLQRAKLPTLHTRRLQAIAIIMYKVKKGLAPSYIADLFIVTNSQYRLRNSDFVIPRFRTVTYGKHSLTCLGPVIWSKLDKFIRSSESLDIFKYRIKKVNFKTLLDNTCKDCLLCNN